MLFSFLACDSFSAIIFFSKDNWSLKTFNIVQIIFLWCACIERAEKQQNVIDEMLLAWLHAFISFLCRGIKNNCTFLYLDSISYYSYLKDLHCKVKVIDRNHHFSYLKHSKSNWVRFDPSLYKESRRSLWKINSQLRRKIYLAFGDDRGLISLYLGPNFIF